MTLVSSNMSGDFRFILHVIVVPTLFAAISLVGLVGNLLVIYVILSNKRMRTVINLLLLNLAVTDLCFVVIVPPFTAFQYIANEHSYRPVEKPIHHSVGYNASSAVTATAEDYPLSGWTVVCKFTMYIVNVTAYTTVYTLVLIAVVRYMTVVHNTRTTRVRTRRNVAIAVAVMWVIALIGNCPVLYKYAPNEYHEGCDVTNDVGKQLFITMFVLGYVFPLLVIALLSGAILRHLARNRVTIARSSMTGHLVARRADMTQQASRLIVIVVVLFAVSWLPIHIHLLLTFHESAPEDQSWYFIFVIIGHCLEYINSCINPFIYNHASRDFCDAFKDAVGCVYDARIQPDPNQPMMMMDNILQQQQQQQLQHDDQQNENNRTEQMQLTPMENGCYE